MLSPEESAFAREARVARLATATADAEPHVVPITFVLFDGAFYFAVDEKPKTTTRLKRLRNIEENPSVALVIDSYDEDWSALAWLMIQGDASTLDSADERAVVIAALRAKYAQYRDMALDGPVVKIIPSKVMSWGRVE